MRSQFFWKLFLGYAAVAITALAIVGVRVGRSLARDTTAQMEAALDVETQLLSDLARPTLLGVDPDTLQRRLIQLGAASGTRFTVIAADGTVVADSDEDPAVMDNHRARPEVSEALIGGRGSAIRFSRTVASNLLYVARRVDGAGGPIGVVRSAVPLTAVDDRIAAVRGAVLVAALLAAVVALVLGATVAHRVTSPLSSMTDVAESIAAGDYGKRVQVAARDELSLFASAFNRMAGELEQRLQMISEDRGKLQTILGGMIEGLVAVDGDERVVHLNARGAEILDVIVTEPEGMPLWQITRIRSVSDAVKEAIDFDREVTREVQVSDQGREQVLGIHAAPLLSAAGERIGAVVVLHDVTDLRRLETVRRDFVANVSHELKTPITAIRGLVDTIVDDDDMPTNIRDKFLGKIQNQALRLSLLVTDLLTLARVESAGGIIEHEELDLREIVGASISTYRAAAEAQGVKLDAAVPDAAVRIRGDAEALELVINNLLDNAIKYTPAGGTVSLRLHRTDEDACLEVGDTGPGIGREHHDRVFERFYRVDKARSRELGGTGLGLSIVKHICRSHGGSVTLESDLGSGSTFRVQIPLAGSR